MEPVEDVIKRAIPDLQDRDYHNLLTRLDQIGVKSDCDLQFVTLKDLKDIIPLIAGRKLMHFLKTGEMSKVFLHVSNVMLNIMVQLHLKTMNI